ncbi:MAG: prepilin-type N-terminal cleavage/methylation domain-containing protein [Patescibacteria group bacterium]|nr:prepilin-type N-terminal cleavage/methylation domain-containing protein [Patescibacteria group bacterium]
MISIFRNKNGFTLIESLIYSTLLAIFLGGALIFVNSIISVNSSMQEYNELIANQEFIERKLHWLLASATNVASPVAGTASATLSINGRTSGIYPVSFSPASSTLFLSLNSGPAKEISNSRVKIDSFLATHFSNSQTSSSLLIYLELSSNKYSYIKVSSTLSYVLP